MKARFMTFGEIEIGGEARKTRGEPGADRMNARVYKNESQP